MYLLLQASLKNKIVYSNAVFFPYRKSLHEGDIEKRKISKLQRREHQKVKRKMEIGKQIEKTLIMEMLTMIMIMSCLWK